jgi:hypothetical protein
VLAFEAAISAVTFGGGVKERPVTVPLAWMLKALSTVNAASAMLVPRRPAEPTSMVPCGATRVTLPPTVQISLKFGLEAKVFGPIRR